VISLCAVGARRFSECAHPPSRSTAGGTFAITEFTEHPEAVTCAPSASAPKRPLAGNHWAAPWPADKTVVIECRFLPALADDGSGLGTRFGSDAPLRLEVTFNTWQLALTSDDDRAALGEDDLSMRNWIRFTHGTALRDPPKLLVLTISPDDGLVPRHRGFDRFGWNFQDR